MNNKTINIIYYIGTALLTFIMCFSAFNYFTNYEMIAGFFESFGYPTYLIYPLAVAKVLGLLAVWTNLNGSLKEWAYAGFFFDILLAFLAHLKAGGGYMFVAIAFVGLVLSYWAWRKKENLGVTAAT